MSPKVSVIIPNYNHAQYVCDAVDSVIGQTYKDFEIIVIDDGSTDNTKDVLRKHIEQNTIRYFYQNNKGLSAARNKGVELAQGIYVKFLDSDDFLSPWQLELQVDDLEKNQSDISVSDFSNLYEDGEHFNLQTLYEAGEEFEFLIESNIGPVHSFLIKKDIIVKAGGFDETLTACEDYDLWLRLLMKGSRLTKVNYVGCCYRLLSQSMSSNTDNMFKQKAKVFEKLNQALIAEFSRLNLHTLDRLYWRNVRLIHQCLARKYRIRDFLPKTAQMQKKIYYSNNRGIGVVVMRLIGLNFFSYVQYLFFTLKKDNYKYKLLNEGMLWKDAEYRKKLRLAMELRGA